MACTTLLVGKNASYDGSTIVARNEDSEWSKFNPKRYAVVNPADQPRRYRCVASHLEFDLPDDPMRYTSIPNAIDERGIWGEAGVNDANVSMSETETLTTNPRVLGADPLVTLRGASGEVPEIPGGIGEEDFLTVVLPYVRTAREGVLRLGELLARFGTYESNGIAFSDMDEVWWMETVGGHHWIARRVPDDCYATIPNQLGIDAFSLEDAFGEQADHLCSPDLREFISENHLDVRLGDDVLNPRDAFGSHSDSDHVYNTPRAWAMQRFLNPRSEAWDAPDAAHGPFSDDIPWCRAPERKVTIEDVKYALSLHYQGTPFDPYGRLGDETTRHMLRPIGINRNSHLSVVQLRPYVPAGVSAIQWVTFGCNVFNELIPLFANVTRAPGYLCETGPRVSTESLYWTNRIIAALGDAHFHECKPFVDQYQLTVAAFGHEAVARTDERATGLDGERLQEMLAEANDSVAERLRVETDDLLGTVLRQASLDMRGAFTSVDA